jgi:hypothetical protein
MPEPRVLYEGTTEPLTFTVTRATNIAGTETLTVSFDEGVTWKTATWVAGSAAQKRQGTITVSDADLPAYPFDTVLKVKVDGVIVPAVDRRVVGRVLP